MVNCYALLVQLVLFICSLAVSCFFVYFSVYFFGFNVLFYVYHRLMVHSGDVTGYIKLDYFD